MLKSDEDKDRDALPTLLLNRTRRTKNRLKSKND